MMTPRRMPEESLEQVLARLHALRRGLDALYQRSEAILSQTEERIQQAQYQLALSRLLLQDLRARHRELRSWDRKRGPHET